MHTANYKSTSNHTDCILGKQNLLQLSRNEAHLTHLHHIKIVNIPSFNEFHVRSGRIAWFIAINGSIGTMHTPMYMDRIADDGNNFSYRISESLFQPVTVALIKIHHPSRFPTS